MAIPRMPSVRLEVPDYDLGLRGKLEHADKAAPGKRLSFCTIVYGLSLVDEVTDTPLGSAANGYPDAFAVPDEATRVDLPWLEATQAVIADMVHEDGSPVLESPRTALRRLAGEYAARDLEPVFGYEYEVYVTHAAGSASAGQPLGRTINGYSLSRISEAQPMLDAFLDRMAAIGIPVEMFHSEIGPGFFEFALAPADALTSADRAARARQWFRETCAEFGLHATFMAKRYGKESGSGGHVHQSLNSWRRQRLLRWLRRTLGGRARTTSAGSSRRWPTSACCSTRSSTPSSAWTPSCSSRPGPPGAPTTATRPAGRS